MSFHRLLLLGKGINVLVSKNTVSINLVLTEVPLTQIYDILRILLCYLFEQ
jgi:hypothetical protein